jgi:hypothetical protein
VQHWPKYRIACGKPVRAYINYPKNLEGSIGRGEGKLARVRGRNKPAKIVQTAFPDSNYMQQPLYMLISGLPNGTTATRNISNEHALQLKYLGRYIM